MFTWTNTSVIRLVTVLSFLASPALVCQTADTAQKAKSKPPHAADRAAPPQVVLETKATIHVANLYAAGLSTSAVCGPNGKLYANIFLVRPNAPAGPTFSKAIVGIDRDGKSDLSIASDQITDVKDANVINFFAAEDALYLLVRAPKDNSLEPAEPQKGGVETLFQKADSDREFIARFDLDGTYRGAIHIDVPISGLQIAVFPSGQFVVAGIDSLNQPKVVLLKPSGVLDRYIEIREPSNEASSTSDNPASLGSRLFVVGLSRLTADGPDILLISPEAARVVKIRNSGVAEEIRLKDSDSGIDSFQAVPQGWLLQFRGASAQQSKSKRNMSILLYARTDGHPIRNYTLETADDLVLGCMYDRELTFLERDTDGKLLLLSTSPADKSKLAPAPDAQ